MTLLWAIMSGISGYHAYIHYKQEHAFRTLLFAGLCGLSVAQTLIGVLR